MNNRKKTILNEAYKKRPSEIWRKEFDLILDLVEENSLVLDLGCGDGSLDKALIERKRCEVIGLDISEEAVQIARRKGVDARLGDLESPLPFADKSFDYVILCDVLEHLFDPLFTLIEALRVSKKYVIVAFPNFAYFKSRVELMFHGIFPVTPLFGYKWYNSQHIRLFSYKDFLKILRFLNARVVDERFVSTFPKFVTNFFPNLLALVCVLKIRRNSIDYEKLNYWGVDV